MADGVRDDCFEGFQDGDFAGIDVGLIDVGSTAFGLLVVGIIVIFEGTFMGTVDGMLRIGLAGRLRLV